MGNILSRYVLVDGLKTHYLEAGKGPTLVLLHSGEFGGCAELTWEYNIEALAEHFHVIAPDWLGYGRSAKIFSFEDMWSFRLRHVASFLKTLYIDDAYFAGNSMGGTMLLAVAAMEKPLWNISKAVVAGGGGFVPDNAARAILNDYDGTREHMARIVQTIFTNPLVRDDEDYIDRRWHLSREQGAWECTAAARFRAPWKQPSKMPKPEDYSGVQAPVLLIVGALDPLREPGFGPKLQKQVSGSKLLVVENAGHCPQIDSPEVFNRAVIDFLSN